MAGGTSPAGFGNPPYAEYFNQCHHAAFAKNARRAVVQAHKKIRPGRVPRAYQTCSPSSVSDQADIDFTRAERRETFREPVFLW